MMGVSIAAVDEFLGTVKSFAVICQPSFWFGLSQFFKC
ncbi:hypothetical protein EMIT0P4_40162 [Pseudomonas sp. IT-P4]